MIDSLEKSIGEISGSTSSGVHQRCLLCDKLVLKATGVDLDDGTRSPGRLTDESVSRTNMKDIVIKRSATAQEKVNRSIKESIKLNSEMAVMRCSIDLPPIGGDAAVDNLLSHSAGMRGSTASKYEERVRSSAGGGMNLSKSYSNLPPNNNNTTNPNSKEGRQAKRAQSSAAVARVHR